MKSTFMWLLLFWLVPVCWVPLSLMPMCSTDSRILGGEFLLRSGLISAVMAETGQDLAPDRDEAQRYKVNVSCLLDPVVKLSQHRVIVEQVHRYNFSPQRPPPDLDDLWPGLTYESPQLKAVLENPATELLAQFISLVSLRGEGMLMGKDGGLVAATNHTTDFWQGDEDQFRRVMDGENNDPIVLAAYRDTSTQHFLIKIAAPVLDSEQHKIGVLVIGFDALVMEFRQLC